jgi:hypothetical protein
MPEFRARVRARARARKTRTLRKTIIVEEIFSGTRHDIGKTGTTLLKLIEGQKRVV